MPLLDEIKGIPGSAKDLRKFGLALGIFFAFFGGIFWWRAKGHPFLFGLSGFFIFFGILFPVVLKPVQKIWMTAALLMGWVMTRVILCALFYLVVAPLGLIIRLSGKDLLGLKKGNRATYWLDHPLREKSSYENQF